MICVDMKKAQKIELKVPLFVSFAIRERYLPYATHNIDAPNPLIAADSRMANLIKPLFMYQFESALSGYFCGADARIKLAVYKV